MLNGGQLYFSVFRFLESHEDPFGNLAYFELSEIGLKKNPIHHGMPSSYYHYKQQIIVVKRLSFQPNLRLLRVASRQVRSVGAVSGVVIILFNNHTTMYIRIHHVTVVLLINSFGTFALQYIPLQNYCHV